MKGGRGRVYWRGTWRVLAWDVVWVAVQAGVCGDVLGRCGEGVGMALHPLPSPHSLSRSAPADVDTHGGAVGKLPVCAKERERERAREGVRERQKEKKKRPTKTDRERHGQSETKREHAVERKNTR